MALNKKIRVVELLRKGVTIPSPESVEIGEEVDIDDIADEGVVIHAGSKIFGKKTVLSRGTVIGYEAPATLENCQAGEGVQLKGGFYKDAVFLEKASAGSGAHVREGTILEEYASIAHNVGLKQTILFPYVTLGSLINFCDCLMAGGTSRKNHSEVGSSYIHFNYTHNQDKATASMMGDVPSGVMMDQNPIFLGGQGGLVGPVRIAYGTVIAAGTIHRKDVVYPDRLYFGGAPKAGNIPNSAGQYIDIRRIVMNNIIYIANLIALYQWYQNVRSVFIGRQYTENLHKGLLEKVAMGIDERMKRLKALSDRMFFSISLSNRKKTASGGIEHLVAMKTDFIEKWPLIEDLVAKIRRIDFAETAVTSAVFADHFEKSIYKKTDNYIDFVHTMDIQTKQAGTQWLQEIVDHVTEEIIKTIPSFADKQQAR